MAQHETRSATQVAGTLGIVGCLCLCWVLMAELLQVREDSMQRSDEVSESLAAVVRVEDTRSLEQLCTRRKLAPTHAVVVVLLLLCLR